MRISQMRICSYLIELFGNYLGVRSSCIDRPAAGSSGSRGDRRRDLERVGSRRHVQFNDILNRCSEYKRQGVRRILVVETDRGRALTFNRGSIPTYQLLPADDWRGHGPSRVQASASVPGP